MTIHPTKETDMKTGKLPRICAAFAIAAWSQAAMSDITVGVVLSQTGPLSSLGIPQANTLAMWPDKIAGEKVKMVIFDDASDTTAALKNTRRLIAENNIDVLLGSSGVPQVIAMADLAAEYRVPQLAMAPVELPTFKIAWTYNMPQPVALMAEALATRMKHDKVKTVGFLGFSESYGEAWLNSFKPKADAAGIKIVAVERYAPPDTSVSAQVLKIMSAQPDAVLVVGAGTAAALPQITLRERGFKGQIYQTHGAASKDLIRVGGKAVEGAIMPAGPLMVAELLDNANPVKKPAMEYVTNYEKKYGADSRTQFGAHAFDALQVLQRVVPVALKKAKPGTPEFRLALKNALESEREIAVSHGVLNYSAANHSGFDQRGYVMLSVADGKWKLLK
jgi:branched-chain amino acid transport system substrate-binding protein